MIEEQKKEFEVANIELKASLMKKYAEERRQSEETISQLNQKLKEKLILTESSREIKTVIARLDSFEQLITKNTSETEQLIKQLS